MMTTPTTPILMTHCPTEETLAAYVDDRLDAATRQEVTKHISSCGECRELVMMASDYQMSEAPENVVPGKFRWIAPAAALAAAAVLAIFVLQPAVLFAPDMDDVRAAAQLVADRPGLGRLSGGFPHKEAAPTFRGPGDDERGPDFHKGELYGIAAELEQAKSPDPHVAGVTDLLIAETGPEFKDAVEKLEAALSQSRGEKRDAIAIDLAAALIAYGRWSNEPKIYERALDLSQDVWHRKKTPEAGWNRATALEELDRRKEAVQAWDLYLQLDTSSPWAAEAKRRRNDLDADP